MELVLLYILDFSNKYYIIDNNVDHFILFTICYNEHTLIDLFLILCLRYLNPQFNANGNNTRIIESVRRFLYQKVLG